MFALLPCLGSGVHNPHPSHRLGSKIPFLSWECSRCLKYPKTNVLFALGLPALWVFNMMNFKVVKEVFAKYLKKHSSCAWVSSDLYCVCDLSRCFMRGAAGIVLSPNSLMVQGQWSPGQLSLLFHTICLEESCFSAITEQSVVNYSISRGVWLDGKLDKRWKLYNRPLWRWQWY